MQTKGETLANILKNRKMKNLRIKSITFLILITLILNSIALYENAKTIDIVITKNMHYQRSILNKIIAIENLQERKVEIEKFILIKEKNKIEEQNQKSNIFFIHCVSIVFLIALLVMSNFEFKSKNKNVC